jgi:hypothetical protein
VKSFGGGPIENENEDKSTASRYSRSGNIPQRRKRSF